MKIPVSAKTGHPTVSSSMLRTYGVSGFRLPDLEQDRGCPRRYKAKYVDGTVDDEPGYALLYGTLIHECLQTMEDESIPPDEAIARHMPTSLPPEAYAEARDDLNAYLERGATPTDKYAALATEQHLTAHLYDDDEYGPIWVQGFLDWIGVDPYEGAVLHGVDYKSNRSPSSAADVRNDLQMRFYDLLMRLNWGKWMRTPRPQVVMHLDSIKFNDVEVRYSEADAEEFHAWLVAIIRRILRDDTAEPYINPGCAHCPVRADCPAYGALPDMGQQILDDKPATTAADDVKLAWRDNANAMRLLLDKAVKEVDAGFHRRALDDGLVETSSEVFKAVADTRPKVDLRRLHAALGDAVFYDTATATKAAIERATKDWPPEQAAAAYDAVEQVTVGSKVKREKKG